MFDKYLSIFRRGKGPKESLRRAVEVFLENDLFDFQYGVRTAFQSKDKEHERGIYQFYSPVSTTTFKIGLNFASKFWEASAYGDISRPCFVDLGCGAGKALILASKATPSFRAIIGLEINPYLAELARKNLARVPKVQVFEERCEAWNPGVLGFSKLPASELEGSTPVKCEARRGGGVFLFNKNSFGRDVFVQSLKNFMSLNVDILYLYQNPIWDKELIERGFELIYENSGFLSDVNLNSRMRIYAYIAKGFVP